MLDEVASVPGTQGVMLDVSMIFVQGIEDFGRKIQPLMSSRRHVDAPLLEAV